jgi:hypothetical protein
MWTVQIQEMGIPFCLIRSKVDKDVESPEGRQIGEKGVLLKIRENIKDSMAENTAFGHFIKAKDFNVEPKLEFN